MKVERRASLPKLGGIIREKKDLFSCVFYAVIILLQFLFSYTGVVLPLYLRLAALILLLLSLVNNTKWLPFVLNLFWETSLLSPRPFLPTETFYILLFTLVIGAVSIDHIKRKTIEPILLITVFYFLVVALIKIEPTLKYTTPLFLSIPIALMVSAFVNDEDDILRLLLSLMLMSLFLSSLFLLKGDQFAEAYKQYGVDRSSWTNANMFGGCVAVGFVCAVGYILKSFKFNRNRILNVVAVATIFLSVPALILNASRGSLLAAMATSLLLLLVSNVKIPYKVIVVLVTIGFAVYLYNSGIFELLEARMGEEDLETGGNRLTIWAAKFDAFREYGTFSKLFGVGQPHLRYLGVFYSTHNDFITAFIGYGLIGFLLFMYFLLTPFILAKKFKLEVLFLTCLLFIEGMVLEPVFRGLLPFYMYYILLYKYSSLSRLHS